MAFEFVDVETALSRPGLRLVTVGGIPSPWTEAAKGILRVKRLDFAAVRLVYDDPRLKAMSPRLSAPSLVLDDQRPRTGWADILLLAERLAPTPSLLPADPADRALVFGLSHELCGEHGLAWTRRVQMVHAGLSGAGGFAGRVARYLARKYGYSPDIGEAAPARVAALLKLFAGRLKQQQASGSPYLVGAQLTAADLYCAAVMTFFRPLPEERCPMNADTRAAFETRDPQAEAALDPILLAHRDRIYEIYLELPVRL